MDEENYRRIEYQPCCYYCRYYNDYNDFFDCTFGPFCEHPKMNKKSVDAVGICDFFDDEQGGN